MVSDTLCPAVYTRFGNLDISITPLTLSQCDAKIACYASMTKDTLSPLLSKIDSTMPRLIELEEALRVKGNCQLLIDRRTCGPGGGVGWVAEYLLIRALSRRIFRFGPLVVAMPC